MPAGRASPMLMVLAVLLPLLVYVNVTVYGPLGDAPELELITLLRLSTALAVTVVTSVLEADFVLSNTEVAVTEKLLVWPAIAPAGTVPVMTNLNALTAPVATVTDVPVRSVKLSGMPSPLASR